jgi:hypothetical protein
LRGVWPLGEKESGDRPNGIKLCLAIDQMFEVGRDLEVGRNQAESVGRKIADSHNLGGVYCPGCLCAVAL